MSAPNFHKTEATHYFAVLTKDCDEETNEVFTPDIWEMANLIDCIKAELGIEGHEVMKTSIRDTNELRSYPSTCIGLVSLGDVELMLTIRSGYYEGAVLDYHQVSDILNEELRNDSAKETRRIEAYRKKYTADYQTLTAIVDEIYTTNSTPLIKTAQFSNGEAIYQKVK